jgi:hypothetical protein
MKWISGRKAAGSPLLRLFLKVFGMSGILYNRKGASVKIWGIKIEGVLGEEGHRLRSELTHKYLLRQSNANSSSPPEPY